MFVAIGDTILGNLLIVQLLHLMERVGHEGLGHSWDDIIAYTRAQNIKVVADLWNGKENWRTVNDIQGELRSNHNFGRNMVTLLLAFLH